MGREQHSRFAQRQQRFLPACGFGVGGHRRRSRSRRCRLPPRAPSLPQATREIENSHAWPRVRPAARGERRFILDKELCSVESGFSRIAEGHPGVARRTTSPSGAYRVGSVSILAGQRAGQLVSRHAQRVRADRERRRIVVEADPSLGIVKPYRRSQRCTSQSECECVMPRYAAAAPESPAASG